MSNKSLAFVMLLMTTPFVGCADDGSSAIDSGAGGALDGAANGGAGGSATVGSGGATPDAMIGNDADKPRDTESDARAAITTLMTNALKDAPSGINGMTLLVHNASDARIVAITVGDFGPDRRVAMASASKLISGMVLMHLVDKGDLSLTSTPRQVLGWDNTSVADATLDQLGGFVSGLPGESLCTLQINNTLQGCAATIKDMTPVAAPGMQYEYGSTHLTVAGAMAEARTGKTWSQLFEEFKQVAGLSAPDMRYYALPRQKAGPNNPLLAGGLVATADEYIPLLATLFHKGRVGDTTWFSERLAGRFAMNPYANATIGTSPFTAIGIDFRYGFTSWLNCVGAATSCTVVSSPGAFGFTPWVDWTQGYYAVLAMEASTAGAAQFSVPLVESLKPHIAALVSASK